MESKTKRDTLANVLSSGSGDVIWSQSQCIMSQRAGHTIKLMLKLTSSSTQVGVN